VRRTWLAPLTLLLALACSDPFVLMPGGKLDGEVRAAPADFTFAGSDGMAQLETRLDEPYSVNLVYTVVGGRLYVNAGDTETRWVKNLTADPRVRLRIDGVLYELSAERVTDAQELAAFAKAWLGQSTFRRDPTSFPEVWVYRLVPRS
jgi:hypothetical protein